MVKNEHDCTQCKCKLFGTCVVASELYAVPQRREQGQRKRDRGYIRDVGCPGFKLFEGGRARGEAFDTLARVPASALRGSDGQGARVGYGGAHNWRTRRRVTERAEHAGRGVCLRDSAPGGVRGQHAASASIPAASAGRQSPSPRRCSYSRAEMHLLASYAYLCPLVACPQVRREVQRLRRIQLFVDC